MRTIIIAVRARSWVPAVKKLALVASEQTKTVPEFAGDLWRALWTCELVQHIEEGQLPLRQEEWKRTEQVPFERRF